MKVVVLERCQLGAALDEHTSSLAAGERHLHSWIERDEFSAQRACECHGGSPLPPSNLADVTLVSAELAIFGRRSSAAPGRIDSSKW